MRCGRRRYSRSLIEASLDRWSASVRRQDYDVNEAFVRATGVPRDALIARIFQNGSPSRPRQASATATYSRKALCATIRWPSARLRPRHRVLFNAGFIVTRVPGAGRLCRRARHYERKRAETALHRLNRDYGISDCNQIMIRAWTSKHFQRHLPHHCDEAGYAWCGGICRADEAKTVRPVAWAGLRMGILPTPMSPG